MRESERKRPFKPRRGPEAPRNQLAQQLREMIHAGELPPGSPPPAERALAQRNNVHRDTVRRAFVQLEGEGLLEKSERGWRVCRVMAHSALAPVLRGSIIVVTPSGGGQHPTHVQPGWSDWLVLGALEGIRAQGHDALMMAGKKLVELPAEALVSGGIRGMLVLDYAGEDREAMQRAHAVRTAGVPVVVYGDEPGFADFDRVYADHAAGVRKILRWVRGRGARRPLLVLPAEDGYWQQAREEGFRTGLAEYGFAGGELIRVPAPEGSPAGSEEEIFERQARHFLGYLADRMVGGAAADALLMASDGNVFPAARACRLLGREPGRDVFLCGFDNYWQGSPDREFCADVPAVTVDKHNYEMGQAAAELLRQRLTATFDPQLLVRIIEPELIVTDSVHGAE